MWRTHFLFCLGIAASVAIATILAQAARSEGTQAHARLAGAWLLNPDQSDAPPGRMDREGDGEGEEHRPRRGGFGHPGGRGFGGSGGGSMGRPGGTMGGRESERPDPEQMAKLRQFMRDSIEGSDRLVLTFDGPTVILTLGDGRVRKWQADGAKHQELAEAGVQVERKTRWDGDELVTECKVKGGPPLELEQTWTRQGDQLVVTTKIQGGRGKGRAHRRVYDREGPATPDF